MKVTRAFYKHFFSEAQAIINTLPNKKHGGKRWKQDRNRLRTIANKLNNAEIEK